MVKKIKRLVLVPLPLEDDVPQALYTTFGEATGISPMVLYPYAVTSWDSPAGQAAINGLRVSVDAVFSKWDEVADCNIYLVTGGSGFANAFVAALLTQRKIDFDYLVWDRRTRKYAIYDWGGTCQDVTGEYVYSEDSS